MVLPSSTRPKCLLLKTLNFTTSCVVSCLLEKLQKHQLTLTGLHLGTHELMPRLPLSVFCLVPLSQAVARRAKGTSQRSQFALELASKVGYYSFDVCSLTEIKWTPYNVWCPHLSCLGRRFLFRDSFCNCMSLQQFRLII